MVENLPTEITVQILSHLNTRELLRLETVCKTFRGVVSDHIQEINFPATVEDLVCILFTFKNTADLVLLQHLSNFFVRHHNIRSINLKKSCNITNKTLRAISSNCCKLIRINLAQCNSVTDAGLLELVKCPELQRYPHILLKIILIVSFLIRIDLTGCTQVTSPAIVKLMKHCTNLQSLHLRGCPVYNQWTKKELKTISIHFPKVSLYPKRTLTSCK